MSMGGRPPSGDDSPDSLDRATEMLEALAEDFPDVADYRYDLSETYAMLGKWPHALDVEALLAAEERLRLALGLSEKLVLEHPNVPDYAASHAQTHFKRADLLKRSGRRDEAEAALRRAVATQTSLVERFAEVARFKLSLSRFQRSLADLLRQRGQLAEARTLLEGSIAVLEGLGHDDPMERFVQGTVAGHSMILADVLARMGEEEAAAEARRQADEHRPRMRPRRRGPGEVEL
jgi:tetratricopeptide (TPR) repeat protein